MTADAPALELRGAALRIGGRILWEGLDLDLKPGEFLAVLGPNGAGKSTLAQAVLGLRPLNAGSAQVLGRAPAQAREDVGYLAQRVQLDPTTAMRGRDFVGLGYDGHRFGFGLGRTAKRRDAVDAALARLEAQRLADRAVGALSGGEFGRLRLAQALVREPRLLICDEPLASLDLASQSLIVDRVARQKERGTAVVFITHEINPVLEHVDRVLYVTGGKHRIGTVAEVMTSQTLSALYGAPIDVLDVRGRLVVVGGEGEDGRREDGPAGLELIR